MKYPPLTPEQVELLRQHYADTPNEVLLRWLGIDLGTLMKRAHRLGLKKSGHRRQEASKENRKSGYKSRQGGLCIAIRAVMEVYFPKTEDAELARYFAVNERTIRRWAKMLGLKKPHRSKRESVLLNGETYDGPDYINSRMNIKNTTK